MRRTFDPFRFRLISIADGWGQQQRDAQEVKASSVGADQYRDTVGFTSPICRRKPDWGRLGALCLAIPPLPGVLRQHPGPPPSRSRSLGASREAARIPAQRTAQLRALAPDLLPALFTPFPAGGLSRGISTTGTRTSIAALCAALVSRG
jgi:hypothetical protein